MWYYLRAMIARYIIFAVILLAPELLAGQTADTVRKGHSLKEATVRGRLRRSGNNLVDEYTPGQKATRIDTVTLKQYESQSMAMLLSQQTPVFVKSYGFNGLATLNFRGASAAQSQVYWHGVPIQNAALGLADISVMPVMLMDNVTILYGGAAALLGSGNVGGALLLNDGNPSFNKVRSLSLCGSGGSFSQYMGGLSGVVGTAKWYVAVKGIWQTARNNFAYQDEAGKTLDMENSSMNGYAVTADAGARFKKGGILRVHAWLQQYYRQVPAALFETRSGREQRDGATRMMVEWKSPAIGGYHINASSSFISDNIMYADNAAQLHTNSTVYQYYQVISLSRSFKKADVSVLAPVQIAWMQAPGGRKAQDKAAIVAAANVKLLDNKLDIAASLRIEAVDSNSWGGNGGHFALPGANARYMLLSWLSVRANVQKTYRVPSLNELYYFPGGNTSLRPEQGWAEDVGYNAHFSIGRFRVRHDVSIFNRNINDWIIWLGGAVWTPHNIAAVHSRGIESENRVEYTIGACKLHLAVNTAYVLATTSRSYLYNDGSIGKQIPYSPRYNGQLNAGFTWKDLYFNYNHTYTGYRFTVADESEYLIPYATGNVQVMYNTRILRHATQLTMQCNNAWNEHYQVVSGRPMPGRYFLAGFRISLL